MNIDELIQTMRQCSLAQVRAKLEQLQRLSPKRYEAVCRFYIEASSVISDHKVDEG